MQIFFEDFTTSNITKFLLKNHAEGG